MRELGGWGLVGGRPVCMWSKAGSGDFGLTPIQGGRGGSHYVKYEPRMKRIQLHIQSKAAKQEKYFSECGKGGGKKSRVRGQTMPGGRWWARKGSAEV